MNFFQKKYQLFCHLYFFNKEFSNVVSPELPHRCAAHFKIYDNFAITISRF